MDLSKKGWRFFEYEVRRYDPITNELYDSGLEAAIKNNRDSFYTSRKRVFYERGSDQKYSPSVIRKKQKELLMKIKEILNSDQTNYRIVISPLYDQLKIDSTDINYLYSEFGKEHVYDFSGINDMTQSIYNYYENSHYRPFIATRVMDSIYVNKVSSYK
jgi:hypothetical protein